MSMQVKGAQPIKLNAKIQKLVDNLDGKVKAIASVSIGGAFAIHGIKIIDSEKGKFVAMPNEKWTDADGQTKYKDTFHAITTEARTDLVNTVMAARHTSRSSESPKRKAKSPQRMMKQHPTTKFLNRIRKCNTPY